jgi:hypothetical protein
VCRVDANPTPHHFRWQFKTGKQSVKQGILTEGEGLGTVHLHNKVACFVAKVNNIFKFKMS